MNRELKYFQRIMICGGLDCEVVCPCLAYSGKTNFIEVAQYRGQLRRVREYIRRAILTTNPYIFSIQYEFIYSHLRLENCKCSFDILAMKKLLVHRWLHGFSLKTLIEWLFWWIS